MRHTPWMHSNSLYHRHRFPAEIISHCVWLYFRFALSFRDVEEMLAMRGVYVSYETVREWCFKFGQTYANGLRRKSPRPLQNRSGKINVHATHTVHAVPDSRIAGGRLGDGFLSFDPRATATVHTLLSTSSQRIKRGSDHIVWGALSII